MFCIWCLFYEKVETNYVMHLELAVAMAAWCVSVRILCLSVLKLRPFCTMYVLEALTQVRFGGGR